MEDCRYRPAGEPCSVFPVKVHVTNPVQKSHSNPGSLPFWEYDQPAGSCLDSFALVPAADGEMTYRLIIDRADVAARGDHIREFQIMMLFKH